MRKKKWLILAAVVGGLVMAAGPLGSQGPYKFSNFVILIDQSSDMNVNYKEMSKNKIAREVAERMLNNIARSGVPMKGAIYEYGIMAAENENRVLRVAGWKEFDLDTFQLGLQKCGPQTGPSTLSVALRKLKHDIQQEPITGWIAVFILSAGNFTDVDDYVQRAKELKQAHPQLCIYTIQIGPNEKGRKNLEEVVKKGKCGYDVNADSLTTGLEVQNYIYAILHQRP